MARVSKNEARVSNDLAEIKKILGMKENEDLAIVTITPDMANRLLKFNTHNRPKQINRVREYTDDMKAGKFCLSESAIGFDSDGVLTNGQTRLQACVEANVPFKSIVCTVLEQNIHMDTGNVRKIIDNIILNGAAEGYIRVNENSLKTVCELLRQNNSKRVRITSEPVVAFCKKYGKYIDEAYDAGLLRLTGTTNGLNRVQIAAAFLSAYINGVDLDVLKSIRDKITTGIITSDEQIIRTWSLKLIKMASRSGVGTLDVRNQIYCGTTFVIYAIANNTGSKAIRTDINKYKINFKMQGEAI